MVHLNLLIKCNGPIPVPLRLNSPVENLVVKWTEGRFGEFKDQSNYCFDDSWLYQHHIFRRGLTAKVESGEEE